MPKSWWIIRSSALSRAWVYFFFFVVFTMEYSSFLFFILTPFPGIGHLIWTVILQFRFASSRSEEWKDLLLRYRSLNCDETVSKLDHRDQRRSNSISSLSETTENERSRWQIQRDRIELDCYSEQWQEIGLLFHQCHCARYSALSMSVNRENLHELSAEQRHCQTWLIFSASARYSTPSSPISFCLRSNVVRVCEQWKDSPIVTNRSSDEFVSRRFSSRCHSDDEYLQDQSYCSQPSTRRVSANNNRIDREDEILPYSIGP